METNKTKTKIVDLEYTNEKGEVFYKGLSIWKVHIDLLREQDKNARTMSPEKFNRLSDNMKGDKKLESLPLVVEITGQNGQPELQIISGHHRVRAARAAGLSEIFVIVDGSTTTRDDIISKQLAHNSLSGIDDPFVLKELYMQIDDIDSRIRSGITDQELAIQAGSIKVDELFVDFNFEDIHILFLPAQFNAWENALAIIEPEARIYIADKKDFNDYKEVCQKISKRENVRNIAGIMTKMVEICHEYLKNKPLEGEEAKTEPLNDTLSNDSGTEQPQLP